MRCPRITISVTCSNGSLYYIPLNVPATLPCSRDALMHARARALAAECASTPKRAADIARTPTRCARACSCAANGGRRAGLDRSEAELSEASPLVACGLVQLVLARYILTKGAHTHSSAAPHTRVRARACVRACAGRLALILCSRRDLESGAVETMRRHHRQYAPTIRPTCNALSTQSTIAAVSLLRALVMIGMAGQTAASTVPVQMWQGGTVLQIGAVARPVPVQMWQR